MAAALNLNYQTEKSTLSMPSALAPFFLVNASSDGEQNKNLVLLQLQ
jgi:hypothetical protein